MRTVNLYVIDLNEYPNLDINTVPHVTAEDIINAKKYKQSEDQKQHIISNYFKRKYAPDWHINPNGKPVSYTKYFNISHSHNIVIYAEVDEVDVGVDVELVKPSDDKLRKYISNEHEYEFIKSDEDFYRIWTSKESVAKCYGSGIIDDIKTIPGIPINGKKFFKEKIYYTKNMKYKNFILSVTINDSEDFEMNFVDEVIE